MVNLRGDRKSETTHAAAPAAGASHCFAQATFHANIARTGVYEAARPARLNGAKWTFKTGGPIVASPAVAGGVVQIAILKPV